MSRDQNTLVDNFITFEYNLLKVVFLNTNIQYYSLDSGSIKPMVWSMFNLGEHRMSVQMRRIAAMFSIVPGQCSNDNK